MVPQNELQPVSTSPQIIDMPAGAKRCPQGFNSVTINGEKKCKKQTRKVK
jgi:hypothetical protein